MDRAERFRELTCTRKLRDDLAGRSVRAALCTAGAGAADFAIRLGSTAILARLVLPEHFGLVMMAAAVVAVADQLRELGLSTATVQRPEITHEEATNLFWVNMGFGAVLMAIVCAASPLIARYYHEPRLVAVACALATTLLAGGLTVQHQALLTRQLKLGHTAAIRLASSAVSTALAIGLAWWDFGYWSLLWREVARAVLLGAGMWLCFPWIPGRPSARTSIRSFLQFGASLTGANLLSSISAGFDRFVLGRGMGAGVVGIYRQAFQLVAAPTDQLLSPLYQVAQPALSMVQDDPPRYRRLYAKMLTLVCLLTMPVSLFMAVYATEITELLLGAAWLAAAPILCVLSLAAFIRQAAGSTAFVLITRARGGTYLGLTVLHNVLLIFAMTIGVHWGVVGVALAEVAVTFALVGPRLHFSLPGSPVTVRLFLTTLARPAAASLAMLATLLAFHGRAANQGTVAALLAGSGVAALSFWGAWLLLPDGRTEAFALLRDVRSAVQRRTRTREPIEAAAATR